jgi:hypothetical protein
MIEPQRWDFKRVEETRIVGMTTKDGGEYVKYEDYKKLQEDATDMYSWVQTHEYERVKAELEKYRALYESRESLIRETVKKNTHLQAAGEILAKAYAQELTNKDQWWANPHLSYWMVACGHKQPDNLFPKPEDE